MNPPVRVRPKPRNYLLSLAMQISKLMDEQNIKIEDVERAIEIIKISRR
ncbi:hypothetical protein [Gilliamella sp. wkB195]|nr:hypothetical protein [Gilliamella apicola]